MRPESWQNRIAVELEFIPVDSPCSLGSDLRRVNGTELMLSAVTSWQPVLCTQPGRLPYAYGVSSDGLARQQLVTSAAGSAGMIAVNRPLPAEAASPENPIVYAPLAASAVTIGFNVERVPTLTGTDDHRLRGVRYETMNLTPRLVTKLLTQSYRSQVWIQNKNAPYEWDDANPVSMFSDPDFQQFNPEFSLWQSGSTKNDGGLVLPAGTSDLASEMWDWILADPEAAAWLEGEPDPWGMVVNPMYATDAEHNSTGFAFGSPPPDTFPKSDPYCYQEPPLAGGVVPPLLCGLDHFPYASGFGEAAKLTSVANDGARTVKNEFGASRPQDVWKSGTPQTLGRRTMLGLTDLPSLTRFGLQAARLSQAGDNGPDRAFIAPDTSGLTRGLASMAAQGGVLQLGQSDVDAGGYPLTTLTYAAVRPLALDQPARDDYAAFLDYAAGPGQKSGTDLGQLPPGYLPLPSALAEATATAADQVRTLTAPATTPEDPPAPIVPGGDPSDLSTFPSDPTFSNDGGFAATPDPTGAPPATQAAAGDPPDDMAPSGLMTPVVALGAGRFVVAAVAVVMLLSALGFLEITKRPRRRSVNVTPPSAPRLQP